MKSIWNNSMPRFIQLASLIGVTAVMLGVNATAFGQTDGIYRLLNRAEVLEVGKVDTDRDRLPPQAAQDSFIHPAATLVPSDHFTRVAATSEFFARQDAVIIEGTIEPLPEDSLEPVDVSPLNREVFKASSNRFHPQSTPQEYVFDGSDRGKRVQVDQNFDVSGLDPEDTIGHFDTLDGQRIVAPSNRVAIYAPRFGAVRKIDGAVNAQYNQPTVGVNERKQTVQATDQSFATTTNQYEGPARSVGGQRASGLQDQTRGVTVAKTLTPQGTRNYQSAMLGQTNLKIGKIDNSVAAQLQKGMQAALAWETDLGLRVFSKGIQPVIVRDLATAQELMHIESDKDPTLNVVKTANVIAARPGDEVEFMIRFDNISSRKIGNVTLMDNLTRRLEYVEGSSECTLKSEFKSEVNDAQSLALRWEIIEPVEPGTGGVIRFRCRVR